MRIVSRPALTAALVTFTTLCCVSSAWCVSSLPAPAGRSIYIVFNAQPVGSTTAVACGCDVPRGCNRDQPNDDLRAILQVDLDRLAASLPIREIEISAWVCTSNAALITWFPASPRLALLVEAELGELPYVCCVAERLAGEPDVTSGFALSPRGAGPEAPGPANRSNAMGRAMMSWGAIKSAYR